MNLNPTFEWKKLYDKFYRKREIYSMTWENVDLAKFKVVGAPFGGPVAMIRDEKKVLLVNQGNLRPTFFIYTSAGKLISSFVWEKGRLVEFGWTHQEKLVCILEDGQVLLYSIWGELLHQFSVGRDAEGGIIECKIWGTGAVCLTGDNQFIAISNLNDPTLLKSKRLAFSGLTDPPQSWVVIDPDHSASQSPEVLAATDNGSVLSISYNSTKDLGISQGPFTKMSVSPNGKLLACFTRDGILWVVSSDFSKNLSQFDTQSKVDPEQMVWCGADSVVLYWDSILLMIGPYAEYFNYSFDEPIHLIAECDGVRIISNHTCEFLQRVPDVVEDIFKIGSTASSAILYDAMDHFEKKSPKADENIRSIKNELLEAVNQCIEAAGHEISHALQRSLLKAASFGKSFLDFYDPTPFVEMCQTLRILNAVQHFEIGIPLTIQQYKMLGPWGLIEKLMNQHEHLLAIKLCEYLKIKSDRVLVHWACTKVMAKKTMFSDSDVCNMIVDKLSHVPGISYAEIASTAYKAGKTELATKLLDYEPRGADQVPLLLSMRQDEVALSKAIESGDTDLVYLVVLHIKRSKNPQEFFKIIKNKVVALDLLISYCKQQDVQLLNDIYAQLGQIQEVANLAVVEAYQNEDDMDKCIDHLQEAYNLHNEAKDLFTSKITEEQIKLLMLQKELESSLGGKYVGDSISECLFKLIKLDQSKRVAKIRSDFKVPDKRFWWIKIKALASVADWMNLEKFAKEKKSPIGYGPFVDICLQYGAAREAEKYVQYIKEPQEKVDKLLLLEKYEEAVEVGRQSKDPNLLIQIRNKANKKEVVAFVDNLLSQLNSK